MQYMKFFGISMVVGIFFAHSAQYVFALTPVSPGDRQRDVIESVLIDEEEVSSEFEWITTKGSIEDLRFERYGRRSLSVATVSFQEVGTGRPVLTNVSLPHIPYITHIHRVGQMVTIEYRSDAPMVARTPSEGLIRKYGLIILIIAGVIISVVRVMKMMAK